MAKMVTVEHRAVGTFEWSPREQARIERNLVALDGKSWEALRFCKNRDGRHNRVHLVITEEDFVSLFADAVKNGVFSDTAIRRMNASLSDRRDSFSDVIGIAGDFEPPSDIDAELYGDKSA
jgi:hypothetical protein